MLELSIVSFKHTWNEYSVHAAILKCLNFGNDIRKSWAFIRALIRKDGINKNLMDLNFSAFFWVNYEPSLDILHVKNGFAENLRAKFLILSYVENLVDSLLSFFVCKV